MDEEIREAIGKSEIYIKGLNKGLEIARRQMKEYVETMMNIAQQKTQVGEPKA